MKLPIVVNPDQVNEGATDGLKIVDLRSLEDFERGHLPGAVHMDASLLNRAESPVGGLLPAFADFNTAINALGIQADDHILAYDKGAETAAARLIWVLHAFGFKATSWLNGGFNAWSIAGLPTSTSVAPTKAGDAHLQFTPGNVLSVDQLLDALYDEHVRVLDVRSAAEYAGTDVRSARGGHVPCTNYLAILAFKQTITLWSTAKLTNDLL